jgi:hypothetical protein
MSPTVWSFLIAPLGVIGLYFVGSFKVWAWIYLLMVEILWIVFAIATKEYGFILSSIGYSAIHFTNWRKWRKNGGNKA